MILPADAPVGDALRRVRAGSRTPSSSSRSRRTVPTACRWRASRARSARCSTASPSMPAPAPAESGAPAADAVHRRRSTTPTLCPRYTARAHPRREDRPVAGSGSPRTRDRGGRALHQQHRRRHQLRDVRARPAAARVRRGHARPRTRAAGSPSACARAAEGEQLTTLDGQERTLAADTLAHHRPDRPGRARRRHGRRGDRGLATRPSTSCSSPRASTRPRSAARAAASGCSPRRRSRFEKAVDRTACVDAARPRRRADGRARGGEVAPGVVDAYPAPAVARELTLRVARLERAARRPTSRQPRPRRILEPSRLRRSPSGADALAVDVPTFRPDLEREIDLDRGGPARSTAWSGSTPTLPAVPGAWAS